LSENRSLAALSALHGNPGGDHGLVCAIPAKDPLRRHLEILPLDLASLAGVCSQDARALVFLSTSIFHVMPFTGRLSPQAGMTRSLRDHLPSFADCPFSTFTHSDLACHVDSDGNHLNSDGARIIIPVDRVTERRVLPALTCHVLEGRFRSHMALPARTLAAPRRRARGDSLLCRSVRSCRGKGCALVGKEPVATSKRGFSGTRSGLI
jgi:hypothetical protein